MATEIDELIVQISADTRQLKTELNRVKGKLDQTFPQGSRSPVAGFATQLKGLIGPLLAVGGAMSAITAVKGIAQVGDEFEALQLTLDKVYGSAQAGEQAFDSIKEFAATTPFQLQDVTKAFTILKGSGVEPTTEMLTVFGDAASAAMDPLEAFNALVRITTRSVGGGLGLEELEQLVNQSIPVYAILEREIGKTRGELSELGQTADGARIIMDALQRGLQKDFGGLMGDRLELLSTKTSNLQDAFANLQATLFEGTLSEMLKNLTDRLEGFLRQVTAAIKASREAAELTEDLPQSIRAALARENATSTGGQMRRSRSRASTVEETIEREQARIEAEIERLQGQLDRGELSTRGRGGSSPAQKARERITALQAENAAIDRLVISRTALNEAIDGVGTAGGTGGTGGGGSAGEMTLAQTELLERMKDVLKDTVTPAEELAAQFADLAALEAAGGLGLSADQIERIRDFLNGIQSDQALDALKDKFGALQSAVDKTVTPVEALQATIDQLQAAVTEGNADVLAFIFGNRTPEEMQDVLNRLKDDLKDLKDNADETAATFTETMAPAIASMAHSFTNDFVAALTSGQDALSSFKDFAKNLVNQIIATFLQMAVVNQILNAIFGRFDGYKPLPTISFGGGQAGESASGGAMMRGKPYLVGERGPELFVPSVAGTLKNGNDTRGMMGGGRPIIVNQNLNFSTGVVPTVRAEVQRMLPQISEVTKSSVLEATRRGGNYRKGLLGA